MAPVGKAFIYESGEGSCFKWKSDFFFKNPGSTDVQVKVISAGLNPVDYKIPHMGFLWWSAKGKPVGKDLCGEVTAVGPAVTGFKVGDVVFGQGDGCCSEYAMTNPTAISKVPEGEKDVAVYGGLGVASGTAYQMLNLAGAFAGTEAKTVMIIGASGGVGSSAVQIAKAKCPSGSKVLAVCSSKSADYVKSIGADEIIDYSKEGFSFATCVSEKSLDAVIDCVSSPDDYNHKPEGMRFLKEKTGQYVAANSPSKLDWVMLLFGSAIGFKLFRGQYQLMFYTPKPQELKEIGDLVHQGKLKIHVDEYVKFEDSAIRKAFDTLAGRRVRGKLIIKM
jgi:NADPH:quinone reductase-like Zn-dependent oxidoreductase